MSDFKQQVEEILFQLYGGMEPCDVCLERGGCVKTPIQCALDRILAAHNQALDEIAEGMPKDCIEVNTFADVFSYNQGAIGQRCLDQAHVKAQKE